MTPNHYNLIKVLDHGSIELIDHMGSDLTVVNAARVSFHKESKELSERDVRLIHYLANHKHWTPFAHPQLSFRIKAPISVHRQWEKARVGCISNTESTRYVVMKPEFYVPKNIRAQGDAKQGSDGLVTEDKEIRATFYLNSLYAESLETYNALLNDGVAREIARDALPLATYTSWIWTASLAACARVFVQRTHDGAQFEIGQFAIAMGKLVEPLFPESWKALTDWNTVKNDYTDT